MRSSKRLLKLRKKLSLSIQIQSMSRYVFPFNAFPLIGLTRIFATQVVTSSGEEVFFKIKRNTKLSKLQGAYAAKVGKDVSSIR